MADEPEKRTHAQRRRKESQEAIRRKLRAAQFIRRLKEIAGKAKTADASAVAGLRLQADIYARLLNKCLPDLKAIEHSGEIQRRTVSSEPPSAEEWERQYAGGVAPPSRPPESVN